MQAVCSIIHDSNGKVFVQMRTAALNVFDQVVLGSRIGTDEQEIVEALMAENGVDEVVTWPPLEWHRGKTIDVRVHERPEPQPPRPKRGDILAAIARCERELQMLRDELSKHHDEV